MVSGCSRTPLAASQRPCSTAPLEEVNAHIALHERRIAELEATVSELNRSDPAMGDGAGTPAPGRRLSPEKCDAMVTRLSRPPSRHDAMTLPGIPGHHRRVLDGDAVAALVLRLGEQDVDLRRTNAEAAQQRELEQMPLNRIAAEREEGAAKLEPSQQEAMGRRLCDEFMARKRAKVQKLRSELLDAAIGVATQKQFAPGTALAVTERVYLGSLDRRKKVVEAMEARYVRSTEVRTRKLTLAQQRSMASRLSAPISH